VGINGHADVPAVGAPVWVIDAAGAARQVERLAGVRRRRNGDLVTRALDRLRAVAAGTDNTMEPILDCVRAYATVGEMGDVLREVWGEYVAPPSI
jgi:methylmalonyl-CoA mutase N-terminal domain/subunit